MNRIEDDRLLFYIEHARQIREWAALGDEVRDAAHEFLTGVYHRFEYRDDLPADAIARSSGIDTDFPHLTLHLATWQDEAGKPLARVGLSWHKRAVGLDPRSAPYVGVTTNPTTKPGKDRSDRLRAALGSHRASSRDKATNWWPTRRRIPPEITDGSIDLQRYETELIAALYQEWEATKAIVTNALTQ